MSSDDFNQTGFCPLTTREAGESERFLVEAAACSFLRLSYTTDSLTSWQLHVHLRVPGTSLILLVFSKSTAVLLFLQQFWEQMAFFIFGGIIYRNIFFPALSSPCASETNLAAEPPAVRDVLRAPLPPHVFLLLLLL